MSASKIDLMRSLSQPLYLDEGKFGTGGPVEPSSDFGQQIPAEEGEKTVSQPGQKSAPNGEASTEGAEKKEEESNFKVETTIGGGLAYEGGDWGGVGNIGGTIKYVFPPKKEENKEGKEKKTNVTLTHEVGLNYFLMPLAREYDGNFATEVCNEPVAIMSSYQKSPWFLVGDADIYYNLGYKKTRKEDEAAGYFDSGSVVIGGGLIKQKSDFMYKKIADMGGSDYVLPEKYVVNDRSLGGYIRWNNTVNNHYAFTLSASVGTQAALFYYYGKEMPEAMPAWTFKGTIISAGLKNVFTPFEDDKETTGFDESSRLKIGVNLGGQVDVEDDMGHSLQGSLEFDWLAAHGAIERKEKDEAGKLKTTPWEFHVKPAIMAGGKNVADKWQSGFVTGLDLVSTFKIGEKVGDLSVGVYGSYGFNNASQFSDTQGATACADGTYGYSGLAQYYGSGTGMKDVGYDVNVHTLGYGLKLELANAFGVEGLKLNGLIGGGSQMFAVNGKGEWTTRPVFSLGAEYTFSV